MKHLLIFLFIIIQTNSYLSAQFFDNNELETPEVNIILELIPTEVSTGEIFSVFATFTIPENYHMFLNEKYFNISINSNLDLLSFDTEYPVNEAANLLGIPSFSGTVTIKKDFKVLNNNDFDVYNLDIKALYQICDENGTCLIPSSKLYSKKLMIVRNNEEEIKLQFLEILKFIFLAFLGGFLLNIMPCVLPLLSIKALNLIEQSNHDKKVILKSSLLYGLGILVSFLTLAAVVIVIKSSGELLGWGFQFQNPLFVLILISVIFIFALSLFGVFTINAPTKSVNKAAGYSAGKSYRGSFLTGIFAVLIATPCTAPFLGVALGFAFSQSPFIIILIFSVTSFGFAFPFILLGLFPKLIKKLPKPGKWMERFEEVMGFLLLGTVVYLLSTLYSLIGSSITGIFWFLLFTGIAVWIYGRFGSIMEKKSKRIISITVALLLISGAAYQFVDLQIKKESSNIQSEDWEVFSTELVEKYRSENISVFIDFYADWCTTCKLNEAVVLNKENIKNLFKEYNVKFLKGDFTSGNEEITRWLSDYKRAGVPLYILFRPGEDAFLFPELLTQSMIEKEIKVLKK